MERIGDETLSVDDLQPPLDNACANILGEMLHANLLRLSGHGGDAAVHAAQIEESLEQVSGKVEAISTIGSQSSSSNWSIWNIDVLQHSLYVIFRQLPNFSPVRGY